MWFAEAVVSWVKKGIAVSRYRWGGERGSNSGQHGTGLPFVPVSERHGNPLDSTFGQKGPRVERETRATHAQYTFYMGWIVRAIVRALGGVIHNR